MISIIDIFSDIITRVSDRLGYKVNYLFGDSVYMRKALAEMDKASSTRSDRYPLIGLFTPFDEDKTDKLYYCQANLNFIIAVDTLKDYTNESRKEYSFDLVLNPVYELFIDEIRKDSHFDFGYDNIVPHISSDNYSYASRGVSSSDGVKFDRIDAKDVINLKLKVKKENCYGKRL